MDGAESNFIPRERRQRFDYWKVLECTHAYNDSAYYADGPEKLKWDDYDATAQTRDAQRYLEQRAQSGRPFLEWMGDSMVALRTYQALRSIEVLDEWPEMKRDDVRFYGEGRAGIHAKLAAALAPTRVTCEWRDGFKFADFVRTRHTTTRPSRRFLCRACCVILMSMNYELWTEWGKDHDGA
ncbi:MAG: hypothetical protein ACREH8_16720 [Opitutaceae bacterium]